MGTAMSPVQSFQEVVHTLFDAVSRFIGLKELKFFFFRGGVDVDVSLLHIIQNRQNVQAEMAYSKHVFVFQLLPMEVDLI